MLVRRTLLLVSLQQAHLSPTDKATELYSQEQKLVGSYQKVQMVQPSSD